MPDRTSEALRHEALARDCERALIAGARAGRAGTRQQVRAAARRFVRRHRRDASHLRWVLRSVRASSALAIALLGLGAAPAAAQFGSAPGLLAGQDVGAESAPAFGDLDGDGDLDLVVGNQLGTFSYFEHTGSATDPLFVPRTGAANPLAGQDVGFWSTPCFGDLDADGDLDLVTGANNGTFSYYENTGNATSPTLVLRTGAANPLDGEDVGSASAPALGDLDRDGDLDLFAGEYYGSFVYYENAGSATSPAFVLRTGGANPLNGQNIGIRPKPALADLEGDGDFELFAGQAGGAHFTFENTGSAVLPAFVARTGPANPLFGTDVGDFSAPTFGDFDGDGDFDLLTGQYDGSFDALVNLARNFVPRSVVGDVGDLATPALGDLDGDGDLDVVSGESFGALRYYENTGSATSSAFLQRTGSANPLGGVDLGDGSTPALGDLDGDGDLDLLAGAEDGLFDYFENTGNAATPAFIARTGAAHPLDGHDLGFRSAPSLGDFDGDGDRDLVAGEGGGSFRYFENTGSPASPAFVARTGAANPFDGQDVGYSSKPALGDVDGDGDLDLAAGRFEGSFFYFENTGSASIPAFVARTGFANPIVLVVSGPSALSFGELDADGDVDLVSGNVIGTLIRTESRVPQLPTVLELTGAANPLDGQDAASRAGAALVDLDRDGDADLVAGESFGTFAYYENTGSAITPAFLVHTSAGNPLGAIDVGDEAKPAFGDLDGDGDRDLLAGHAAGGVSYFQNNGDATTPLFGSVGLESPFGLQDVGQLSAPSLGDADGDGDLDLAVGKENGAFRYFENTGSSASPAFVDRSGALNPLSGFDVGSESVPALADFDRDGSLDLVVGESGGTFAYFRNQGGATDAAFVRLTGAANPLAGRDLGDDSAPAAGPLNGDGFPDLVTGSLAGTFAVHYFPEPARALLLGAGASLLELLRRWRTRYR